MTDTQKAIAHQLVLSDFSYREWDEEAAALPIDHEHRAELELQKTRDKQILSQWEIDHQITPSDIADTIIEVTDTLLAQLHIEQDVAEATMLAEWTDVLSRTDQLGMTASNIHDTMAAITQDHSERREKLQKRIARIQAVRSEGLQWRQ